MKKKLHFLFYVLICLSGLAQRPTNASSYQTNWTVNPFDHKLFVENLGQFDKDLREGQGRVHFFALLGTIKAYFTPGGIVYRYDEFPKRERNETGEKEKEIEL